MSVGQGTFGTQEENVQQKPTVGRIVHYQAKEGQEPHAAIITRVHSDTCVNLVVFDLGTQASCVETSICLGSPGQVDTWSWPPRA